MPKKQKPKTGISVNITGDISGQVVVGNHNKVIKSVAQSMDTSAELDNLRQSFLELRNRVQAEIQDDKKELALERVNQLEHTVFEKRPDLTTIEHARNWFGENLPALAGSVEVILNHPALVKVMTSAGNAFAEEFKKRFL